MMSGARFENNQLSSKFAVFRSKPGFVTILFAVADIMKKFHSVQILESCSCDLPSKVVLAWRTLQLDLRTPALYQMGSLDCHCPLTQQWCSINLRKGVTRIKPELLGEKREHYRCAMPPPPQVLRLQFLPQLFNYTMLFFESKSFNPSISCTELSTGRTSK